MQTFMLCAQAIVRKTCSAITTLDKQMGGSQAKRADI
jgi:hypothetical protein